MQRASNAGIFREWGPGDRGRARGARGALSGEAPDRGVPAAVRRGKATKPAGMQRDSNAGIFREWASGGRLLVPQGLDGAERRRLAGRVAPEEDPDPGGEAERDEDGPGRGER